MAIKTIKKAMSLSGLTMTLIIVMAFFFGMFLYWNQNLSDTGEPMNSKYVEVYTHLNSSMYTLDNNVNAIKSNVQNITEADNAYQVAWNGLKGLGNTLKLPISFVSTSIGVFTAITAPVDFLPTWVIALFFIGATALIIFLVLSILKGDPKL